MCALASPGKFALAGPRLLRLLARRERLEHLSLVLLEFELTAERLDAALAAGAQPQCAIGRLQQPAVVRDEDHAALEAVDRRDQRVDRLDVEVVGRLVEQQHVRPLRGESGEDDAGALAAGQVAVLELVSIAWQALGAKLRAQLLVLWRATLRPATKETIQVLDGAHSAGQRVDEVLIVRADPQVAVGLVDIPFCRGERAGEQVHERRLTAAVGTDKSDARVHRQLKVELREEIRRSAAAASRAASIAKADLLHGDERRIETARRRRDDEAHLVLLLKRRRCLDLLDSLLHLLAPRLRARLLAAAAEVLLQPVQLLLLGGRALLLLGSKGCVLLEIGVVVAAKVVELPALD